jgi:hypothetical protein
VRPFKGKNPISVVVEKRVQRGPMNLTARIFAIALVITGIALSVWTLLPVETTESVIQIKGNLEGYPASPLRDRLVKITQPVEWVAGTAQVVEVSLIPAVPADPATHVEVDSLEAWLDLPGADIFPAASLQAPYLEGRPVSFRWLVTAQETTLKEGRIWLYEHRKTNLGEVGLSPLLARPLELPLRSFFGFAGQPMRKIGIVLTAAGLFWTGWLIFRGKTKK